MERKQRHLNCKRNKESQEQPLRRRSKARYRAVVDRRLNGHEVKAAGFCIQPENPRQHEYRRDHGVQEKLDGRIHPASVPVHSNQQGHGNQRRFPEEVKQEQVERDENPDQSGFQDQKKNEKLFDPLVNRIPRNQHTQRRQERGQHHQPQRNAVHAHVVMNVGRRNPGEVALKLEARLVADKVRRQMQRQNKRQQRNDQREQADIAITPREKQQQQRARRRGEGDQRQNVLIQPVHGLSPTQSI